MGGADPLIGSPLLPVLLGPFAGSFLGVLIRRLPEGRPVALARSACEGCGSALRARDLVPLASFVALRGRCRACGAAIARFHPAVEIAASAVAAIAVLAAPDAAHAWAGCVLGWALLALAWIDWEHWRLPDALTLPLLLLGLAATGLLAPPPLLAPLTAHAAAAALGYLAFRGVSALYRRLRGRDGLGEGDAKLLAAAGAWVGPAALSSVILVAALAGLVLALGLRLRGRAVGSDTALPFGPCLAFATWAVWLWGGG